jgi:hypothetical protein
MLEPTTVRRRGNEPGTAHHLSDRRLMPQRKPDRPGSRRLTPPRNPVPAQTAKLTKTELDLLSHLENGFQLESDALGSGLLLRNLKDDLVVRTASANQSTIKGLEERGLIKATPGPDKLTTIWRATKSAH